MPPDHLTGLTAPSLWASLTPLLLLFFLALAFLPGCTGSGNAPRLGVLDGRLSPCPSSPNCISSQNADPDHAVEPLDAARCPEKAMAILAGVLEKLPGAKVVKSEPDYIRAEYTSSFFGFVDDLEFLADKENRLIHVRSASRVGYWDLGANRRRLEEIRTLFRQECAAGPGK